MVKRIELSILFLYNKNVMYMKVIFLDFNGIVDTYEDMDEINLGNLDRLKKLCELCNASVVYSSSNRYSRFGKELVSKMMELGLDIVGVTPKLGSREEEIRAYLEEHPEIDNYCVLDDDYDMDDSESLDFDDFSNDEY